MSHQPFVGCPQRRLTTRGGSLPYQRALAEARRSRAGRLAAVWLPFRLPPSIGPTGWGYACVVAALERGGSVPLERRASRSPSPRAAAATRLTPANPPTRPPSAPWAAPAPSAARTRR